MRKWFMRLRMDIITFSNYRALYQLFVANTYDPCDSLNYYKSWFFLCMCESRNVILFSLGNKIYK